MKVTIETKLLQELTNRVMKGVGNNDSIMRTCWIGIKCENNVLSMTAWDGENYIQVRQDKVICDDFKVTVTANTFAQLISKTTSENISMELNENYLEVKGNGKYKLQLPVNDEGELDNYPELLFSENCDMSKIKLSAIIWAIEGNKVSLAKTPERPSLMCYYFGKDVLTTNNTTAAMTNVQVFKEPILLKAELVNLVATMETEDIQVYKDETRIMFETPKTTILGYYDEGKQDFEDSILEPLNNLFNTPSTSSCSIEKDKLLGVLDRILLFVPTKEEGVRAMFTDKGIQFYNKSNSVNELLAYSESKNFQPFEVNLQLDVLKDLIVSTCGEKCFIEYGNAGYLKFGKEKRHHLLTVLGEAE